MFIQERGNKALFDRRILFIYNENLGSSISKYSAVKHYTAYSIVTTER